MVAELAAGLNQTKRMHLVTEIDGWKLIALDYGEKSPLENHGGMELAADDDAREFFASRVFIQTYGTDSVVKSCRKYIAAKTNPRK